MNWSSLVKMMISNSLINIENNFMKKYNYYKLLVVCISIVFTNVIEASDNEPDTTADVFTKSLKDKKSYNEESSLTKKPAYFEEFLGFSSPASTSNSESQARIEALQERIDQQTKHIEELERKSIEQEALIEAQKKEKKILLDSNNILFLQNKNLTAKNQKLTTEHDALTKSHKTLATDHEAIAAAFGEAKAAYESATLEYKEAKAEYERKLVQRDRIIVRQSKENTELSEKIDELTKLLEKYRSKST